MSTLRELEICQSEDKKYYFTILEDGKRVYTSDTYEDSHECAEIGVAVLDQLHEERPLRSNDTPRHVISVGRKHHDQNE